MTTQFDGAPTELEIAPPTFLSLASKETADNYPLASQIYDDLAAWLETTGCLRLVSPYPVALGLAIRLGELPCIFYNLLLTMISRYAIVFLDQE
jgi:hypothetical protein